MNRLLCVMIVAMSAFTVAGCDDSHSARDAKTKPATISEPDERQLATIKLTPRAEERLGISTVALQFAEVERTRTIGGELVVPPGQSIIVSAPVAGTLAAPENGAVPKPGSLLTEGQTVFTLLPLLTPERDVLTPAERVRVAQSKADLVVAQTEAEREVEAAKLRVEVAQINFDRAKDLLANKAGSQRTVDETQALLKLAREALLTAEKRHEVLAAVQLDADAGELMSRTVTAPVSGVLQSIDAAVGETVSAGERLFDIAQIGRLWVRVPLYVGQRREVDDAKSASIAEYGALTGQEVRTARPVTAPPLADSLSATIDLYYELGNDDAHFYPGQKVSVTLPLRGQQLRLVIPWSAIQYDIHGGAWVYVEKAPQAFERSRVEVEFLDADRAVLSRGPDPGTQIVVEGVAELYGTEFGIGK